jgi:hypothetical protein
MKWNIREKNGGIEDAPTKRCGVQDNDENDYEGEKVWLGK